MLIIDPPISAKNDPKPANVAIKKEPRSPGAPHTRPRPSRLDLSKNKNAGNAPATALGLPGRDGLGIQEVGIACLSPGFVTQDPVMKEQLQRSMSVRDQQLKIIEARMNQQSAKGDGPGDGPSQFHATTPGFSSSGGRNKKRPNPIMAPSHSHVGIERAIQSAPLRGSFTGAHHPPPQFARPQVANHGHQYPPPPSAHRLPPISDVFSHGQQAHAEAQHGYAQRPLASPSHPPPQHASYASRPREYKSAEEAQQDLAAGRPELIPKIVHYGGHQPPTPPSPVGASRIASGSGPRRRTRAEYEEGHSPPLGHGPASSRRGPFGAGVDSSETQRAKREEFLRLCERAWDLFHS